MILFPSDCEWILCALLRSPWPAQSPKECGVCNWHKLFNDWKKDGTGERLFRLVVVVYRFPHARILTSDIVTLCRHERRCWPFSKTSTRRTTLPSSSLITGSAPGRNHLPKQPRKTSLKPWPSSNRYRPLEVNRKTSDTYAKCHLYFPNDRNTLSSTHFTICCIFSF